MPPRAGSGAAAGQLPTSPTLTLSGAARQFYLDLRTRHQSPDSTPITTRQIESLIRLAEARARIELRETVTEQDAEDVVEVMRCSLFDVFSDEYVGVVSRPAL